ncbi:hypothetical protein TRAPUB_1633 [Trametes pubescens]|uniref:DUF6532 domain-containing protein n=1 Tax=Trametes pubescens TaxID=154538 RepID=A0A1M2VIX7_TRAPU|nr:hypothetical protein TRAPUB_1633 [Trametes pubescens]
MPRKGVKGEARGKATKDEMTSDGSSSDKDNADDPEFEEEESGSEKSKDVEWGGFSQKAVMAETPMWVDDETEEPSSSHTGMKNKTTHRRHTSAASLSSCATDPPSSADGDSSKERAPSLSLTSRHQAFSDNDDEDDDDSTHPSGAHPLKKSTAVYGYRHTSQMPKKKSRAQAAQEAETPQWNEVAKSSKEHRKHRRSGKSKAVKVEEAADNLDNAAERPTTTGVNIELVYPEKQWTELPIGLQCPRVRKVAHISIYKVSRSILFDNAFPDDGTAQALYATTALVETASELGYTDIKAWLLTDEHLQPGPSCKGDVDWLLESLRYIYPWHTTKGDTPVQKRRPVSTMPFQNEAILEVVSACFFSGKPSIAEKYKMEFGSSLEDAPDELELPAAMLALASTAVGSSITDWRSGTRPKKAKGFSADANQDLYNANIKVLDHLRSKERKKYHVLMHGLYMKLR